MLAVAAGAVLISGAFAAIWVASDVNPAPEHRVGAVPPPALVQPKAEPQTMTAPRLERPRAEAGAVVTASFTSTASLGATPELPTRSFASEAEELSFWRERLAGEALTLEGLTTSEAALTRVLDGQDATTAGNRASLEARRDQLRAKLGAQRARVERMESRIAELSPVRGSK